MTSDAPEDREIADLLPWYATGSLSGRDRKRVLVALASDPALQQELSLILEERNAVLEANEAVPGPSRAAVERFYATLNAQPRPKQWRLSGWVTGFAETLRPQVVALAGVTAVVLLIVQAGVISGLLLRHPATYSVASVQPGAGISSGGSVLVSFDPKATIEMVERLLADVDATIVDGPLPGGLYKLRVGDRSLSKEELATLVAKLKARKPLIRFVAPESAPD